jgi:hypothetical protein
LIGAATLVDQEVSIRATKRETSAELKALKKKVNEWRKRRDRRTRIPQELWEEAVRTAEIDGVWARSRATRFNYPELKERLAGARRRRALVPTRMVTDRVGDGSDSDGTDGGREAFVELCMRSAGDGKRTVVELMRHSGDRMRVEVAGGVDLAGLARAFFGRDAR